MRGQEESKKRSADSEVIIEDVTEDEAATIKKEKAEKKAEEGKDEGKDDGKDDGNEDDKDDDGKKEPPPPGNGGKTEKYVWTQTLEAAEVHVPVRPGVKAKQVICDIGTESLRVGIKGEELILSGKLHERSNQ